MLERLPRHIWKPHRAVEIHRIEPPSVHDLAEHKIPPHWFLPRSEANGDHTADHLARVLVWTELLRRVQEQCGWSVDGRVTSLSAVTHDIMRQTDLKDPEHGLRAAQWIEDNLAGRVSPDVLRQAMYVNTYHALPDEHIPVHPPELVLVMEADALDRARGNDDLNLSFIRLPATHNFIQPARELLLESRRHPLIEADPFEAVFRQAVGMGLLSDGRGI